MLYPWKRTFGDRKAESRLMWVQPCRKKLEREADYER
jgi:hypothetical protein